MKAKDIPCVECGGMPEIFGADLLDMQGPWGVACQQCGTETVVWAYQREAWAQWRYLNTTVADTTVEYKPYGPEWEKALMKHTKAELIQMLREALQG